MYFMARFSFTSFRQTYGRYILVGAVVFVLGLIVHFPVYRLAPMMTEIIEKNSGYRVEPDQMSVVMPLGIAMTNVKVQGPNIGNITVDYFFESIRLYPSIGSLLTYVSKKSLGVSFRADRGKERWSGSAAYGPKYTDVDLKGSNLDYSIIYPLDEFNAMMVNQTLTLSSKFDFEINLEGPTPELSRGDLTKAQGSFWMTSKDTTVENALLGEIALNDTGIEATLDNKVLTVEDAHFLGERFEMDIEGAINLQPNLQASKIDKADIRIFVDPALSQLHFMVQNMASANQVQFENATMNFRISGPVNNMPKWRVTNL